MVMLADYTVKLHPFQDHQGNNFPSQMRPLTPRSLTLILAYIHHYAPRRLAGRRLLAPHHLQKMAAWLGLPQPTLRVLRQHWLLAAHFAALDAACFLTPAGPCLQLLPQATAWLCAEPESQLAYLHSLLDSETWSESVNRLGLGETLGPERVAFLKQKLPTATSLAQPPYGWWQELSTTTWRLALANTIPCFLLFHLLQLGRWSRPDRLTCTPRSVALALHRGYAPQRIQHLLAQVTGSPLPAAQEAQLQEWLQQARAYHLQPVHLLTTAQDEQMRELLQVRRFRPYILRHLSPRHLVVRPDIAPLLERWLAQRDYTLDGDHSPLTDRPSTDLEPGLLWLGLRVLLALGAWIEPPYPPPHAELDALAAQLSPTSRATWQAIAQQIEERLARTISGWDAFLPALSSPTSTFLATITDAIRYSRRASILYRSPADPEPRQREILPLYLERQGNLYYLRAYCYLAEAERTFRLDRIQCFDLAMQD